MKMTAITVPISSVSEFHIGTITAATNKRKRDEETDSKEPESQQSSKKKFQAPEQPTRRSLRLQEQQLDLRERSPERRCEPKHREYRPGKPVLKWEDGCYSSGENSSSRVGFYSPKELERYMHLRGERDGDQPEGVVEKRSEGKKSVNWLTDLEW
ncbi:hypothetical protein TRVA0_056S00694 [Trichomonascus vanleenenianus]|uniref:uncharacterized protein n=1 Tax=Trichomonascus vanleenenianus TaxID=2268995 RepID=UPI003ECAEECC